MDAGAGSIKLIACLLLVLLGAYFASAETAFARANKIKLRNIADDGDKRGKRALHIINRFEKALVTILIGNNIAHLACSSLATLAVIDFFGEGHTLEATIVTTLVVFFFAETLPKSFANANSEKTALAYSSSMSLLMKLLTPVSFVFIKISDLMAKLFGGAQDTGITEEELETIIDTVEESGTLDEEQADLLQGAVEFTKTPVSDVMTMREDICGVDIKSDPETVWETIKTTAFSRLLAYDGTIDKVVGVLSIREYMRARQKRGSVNLRRVIMPVKTASPDTPIDDLFKEMSSGKQQFLVVRENDTTVGIATIEDFLEEIVGEIWDEYDEYDEDFIKLGGNYFQITPKMKLKDALLRIGYTKPIPLDLQKKTLEAWLRSNVEGELKEGDGFVFDRLAVTAGEFEDGNTLTGVIIRLCDSEEEAKEEFEE